MLILLPASDWGNCQRNSKPLYITIKRASIRKYIVWSIQGVLQYLLSSSRYCTAIHGRHSRWNRGGGDVSCLYLSTHRYSTRSDNQSSNNVKERSPMHLSYVTRRSIVAVLCSILYPSFLQPSPPPFAPSLCPTLIRANPPRNYAFRQDVLRKLSSLTASVVGLWKARTLGHCLLYIRDDSLHTQLVGTIIRQICYIIKYKNIYQ